jgi:hypothetical protein
MTASCFLCGQDYDDARCSTLCPHREFLTAEEAKQKDLAVGLLRKRIRFAHLPPGAQDTRVTSISHDGMVTIEGLPGEFAPHLFVVIPEEE